MLNLLLESLFGVARFRAENEWFREMFWWKNEFIIVYSKNNGQKEEELYIDNGIRGVSKGGTVFLIS